MSASDGSGAPPFAADALAVKRIGKASWQSDRIWPVSDAEFWDIAEAAHTAFDAALAALDANAPDDGDVLLADTAFLSQTIQALHIDLAEARAAHFGRSVMFGAPPPFAIVRDADRSVMSLLQAAAASPLPRRIAVRLAKRVLLNRGLSLTRRVAAATGSADACLIGTMGPLLAGYAARHSLRLDALSVADIASPQALARETQASSGLRHAAESVAIACAEHMQRRHGVSIDPAPLMAAWRRRLAVLAAAHRLARRRSAPRVVMLGETSKTWPKILGLGLRRAGSRLVGSNHGYFIGQMSLPGLAWHTHAPCDEIVCYSPVDADLLARDYAATAIAARRPVRFEPHPGRTLLDSMTARLSSHRSPNRPARSVMLIGYPMTPQRYAWSAGDYFAIQLDAELRIARALRKAGRRVIYKMHPDRLIEAQGLFEDEVDEIVTSRFEEVWDRADAFVFGNIMTTVFNVAALTDRPIAALDIAGYRWMPGVRDVCARRVHFVPAALTPGNRLAFNEAIVLHAIDDGARAVDRAYADQYLLRAAPPAAPSTPSCARAPDRARA